ncbi:MAG: hypothetical protein K6E92_01935 [Lachnospiraceae bacterium]|nr:hypothetical protein [Lachnospiraceae bacterium]
MNRKEAKREKGKKDPVIRLLDGIIVVLIFVTLWQVPSAWFYKNRADRNLFSQDAEIMSFELQKGDYAGLIQGSYFNDFGGDQEPDGYRHLADYAEAAFLYRVYHTMGDSRRADLQKAVMEEARAGMGELTVFADKVDRMIPVTE